MTQKRFDCIDGETLISTPLPPIRFIINGLLPQGLHILAGAPKVGKSWLALWLCLCVAKGEQLWELPVTKGDALYLCLEDSYSRIQTRLLDIRDRRELRLTHIGDGSDGNYGKNDTGPVSNLLSQPSQLSWKEEA